MRYILHRAEYGNEINSEEHKNEEKSNTVKLINVMHVFEHFWKTIGENILSQFAMKQKYKKPDRCRNRKQFK